MLHDDFHCLCVSHILHPHPCMCASASLVAHIEGFMFEAGNGSGSIAFPIVYCTHCGVCTAKCRRLAFARPINSHEFLEIPKFLQFFYSKPHSASRTAHYSIVVEFPQSYNLVFIGSFL